MRFPQRLAYYLFGLLIGCMFLFYFFAEKKTEFCYLPNCRVLKELRSKPLENSPEVNNKLKEGWFTDEDLKLTLTYGDVIFSESKKELEGGKLYTIEGKNTNNEAFTVQLINYDDKVTVFDINKKEKK